MTSTDRGFDGEGFKREGSKRERLRSTSPTRPSTGARAISDNRPIRDRMDRSAASQGSERDVQQRRANRAANRKERHHRRNRRTTSAADDNIVWSRKSIASPAQHAGAEFQRSATEPVQSKRNSSDSSRNEKRSSHTAAVSSSHGIDAVIAQYREHCDVHMATLLELKNNITTTEKAVIGDTEKDREFQQIRQWYSALAEKHTKLQKEHQALQEEHVKLQENYMNLKRASSLNDSFVAHFAGEEKEEKKKKKKEKGKLEVVWSRAGNITKKAHQKLT